MMQSTTNAANTQGIYCCRCRLCSHSSHLRISRGAWCLAEGLHSHVWQVDAQCHEWLHSVSRTNQASNMQQLDSRKTQSWTCGGANT
jgi:hypothetical protein